MNVQEFAELAAGYALDALSPEDAEAFEAALAEHPEWASIVETDAATVADLATGVAEVEPPAHVRGGCCSRSRPSPSPPSTRRAAVASRLRYRPPDADPRIEPRCPSLP